MPQTVEIIADSNNSSGTRITTVLLQMWRGILPELTRHRCMSFSVASSRAIPAEKVLEQVKNDPFIPIRFIKAHKGMQGIEYIPDARDLIEGGISHEDCVANWLRARDNAVQSAEILIVSNVTKQLVNRLLEPWTYSRVVVTSTDWDNFFLLRNPWHWYHEDGRKEGNHRVYEDDINLNSPAEIHIQDLAIEIRNALINNTPEYLVEDQWHLPFITEQDIQDADMSFPYLVKISAARCAMTSYNTNSGKSIESELKLAERLMKDCHWSPFEHQAKALPYYDATTNPANYLDWAYSLVDNNPGLNLRYNSINRDYELHSGNLFDWIQARGMLET